MWALQEIPSWAKPPEVMGAVARLPSPETSLSERMMRHRALSLLERQGDRGWSTLVQLSPLSDQHNWLVGHRVDWPPDLPQWPEERVRAMAFMVMAQDGLQVGRAVNVFVTIERREELTLARWLTNRAWPKGSRVLEVMKAAKLDDSPSTYLPCKLWRRMLQYKRDGWLTPDYIEELDKNYARSLWTWLDKLQRL